ncbi:protein kinase, partial [Clostridium sp.]|uniref:protein kinase n=1 Tax=Clostridium sp. TaxID=1506 RepID=UPI0034646E1D
MTRRQGFFLKWSVNIEKYLRESEVLGHGNNGIVYLLPNGRVMKVFGRKKVCDDEYFILKKASKKSPHFPKVYERGENYIIRDYVGGKRLDKYLKKHKLDRVLCINLINLIKDFEKLEFKKLDIRCKDLYVQSDLTLKIIDPKQSYTKNVPYPRHLMKGIEKKGQLSIFLSILNDYDKELY